MRSCGCWDAPGAVEEGVAQRGEDGDVVRPGGGDVGTDAAEGLEPAHAPPAPADLGLELGHPFGQLVGLLAGAFDARGGGGAALLGGVGVQAAQLAEGCGRQVGGPGVDRGVDRPQPSASCAACTPTPPSRASPPTPLASKAPARRPTSWPNGWPSGSTRCCTSPSTSTSTSTNNSCEQAIRMAKLQAKISGSWRSMRGLKAFCRIRSYIATARAHDVPVFTALRDAFLDSPWSIPATA